MEIENIPYLSEEEVQNLVKETDSAFEFIKRLGEAPDVIITDLPKGQDSVMLLGDDVSYWHHLKGEYPKLKKAYEDQNSKNYQLRAQLVRLNKQIQDQLNQKNSKNIKDFPEVLREWLSQDAVTKQYLASNASQKPICIYVPALKRSFTIDLVR